MVMRSNTRSARRDQISSSSSPYFATTVMRCRRAQLNSLWSIWYCVAVLSFEVYLTAASIRQFSGHVALPWPDDTQPLLELNAYVGFVGAAAILLPFFIVAAVFRIGNLANDGHNIGSCGGNGKITTSGGTLTTTNEGKKMRPLITALRTMWRHSGPTAPVLHIISAFCLLFPKVLVQAKLIKHGFLHKDEIWRTDLDFMVTHKDRIVVLSILASASNHSSAATASPEDALTMKNGAGAVGDRHDEMTPISPEFFNYAVALFVYSVRYPAIFWETNKTFSILFSVQLMLGSIQSLLAFSGFSVFYKLHAYGVEFVLSTSSNADFVLSRSAAIFLYIISSLLVGLSGCVVYFYGLRKLQAFVVREREKHHISWRESSKTLWGYLPHCIAFAVLVLVAICSCPLLSDYTTVYKGSLDGSILASVVGTIMFLFLWIVLWFTLTLKQQWHFRVIKSTTNRPFGAGNGKAGINVGRISNEIELQRHNKYGKNMPLIVISHGQTFAIKEVAPKKAIMNVILKHVHQQKHHQQVQQKIKNAVQQDTGTNNDVYWLRPKSPSLSKQSTTSGDRKKSSPSVRHKVTFEDTFLGGNSRSKMSSPVKVTSVKNKKQHCVKFEDLTDTDEDGDYATLRDIRLIRDVDDENHDQACLEELLNAHEEDEDDDDFDDDEFRSHNLGGRSPSLIDRDCNESGHLCLIVKSPVHQINVAVTVHDESPSPSSMCPVQQGLLKTSNPTPPPLTNHGHHQDDESHVEVTMTRSNSLSSSCSPPEKGANSDTSSGIHSSSSICDNNNGTCSRKSSSMDDLMPIMVDNVGDVDRSASTTATEMKMSYNHKPECVWKSMSLQRTPSSYSSSSSTASSSIPSQDSTMVILRKQWSGLKIVDDSRSNSISKQEPFGRATNMRLTSFTESPEMGKSSSLSLSFLNNKPTIVNGMSSSDANCPKSQMPINSKGTTSVVGSPNPLAQREFSNYSLTSSGESENCLSHT